MKISQALTPDSYEFACHSKACAPPPAGSGGSKGGKGGGASDTNSRMRANKAKADAAYDAERKSGGKKPTITLDKVMGVQDKRHQEWRKSLDKVAKQDVKKEKSELVDWSKTRTPKPRVSIKSAVAAQQKARKYLKDLADEAKQTQAWENARKKKAYPAWRNG